MNISRYKSKYLNHKIMNNLFYYMLICKNIIIYRNHASQKNNDLLRKSTSLDKV